MNTADLDLRRGTTISDGPGASWTDFKEGTGPVYECRVVFVPEEEGGYSAHCLNLPGVISQGDDVNEAIENIADAFRETILYHLEAKEDIPWEDVDVDRPKGTIERWILVKCGQ